MIEIRRKLKALMVILIVALLGACASTPVPSPLPNISRLPQFNQTLFEPAPVVNIAELTRLSESQKQAFFEFYNNPKFALTSKGLRVATYLGLLLDQFTYSEKTYTAQQSIDARGGNCLSLTMLTTAIAQLVDVEISYQLLEQNPVYNIDNNLLITSDHLRAVVHSRKIQTSAFDTTSVVRIDYFDTAGLSYVDNISVPQQMSMFYSNIAVEKLLKNDYDSAFANAEQALALYSSNASALNTIGILHRRMGDQVSAEKIYEYGARHFAKGAIFVNNYTNLLRSTDREVDIDDLLNSVGDFERNRPWQWILAGQAAYQAGDYSIALRHFKRAIKLAPDLHQVYLFAGRSSYALGKAGESKAFLEKALELAKDAQAKSRYKQKLFALRSETL